MSSILRHKSSLGFLQTSKKGRKQAYNWRGLRLYGLALTIGSWLFSALPFISDVGGNRHYFPVLIPSPAIFRQFLQ
jgi:hypothetical protein